MVKKCELTFKDGCEKYLDNCRQRNLREGTINHYKQSYKQFYKFFNPDMKLTEITLSQYKEYVCYLREHISNDISINMDAAMFGNLSKVLTIGTPVTITSQPQK